MDISALLVRTAFLAAALLFILGIKRMASPLSARSGIQWAGAGMVLATVASFFYRDESGQALHNLPLILAALALGTVAAWVSGKKVAMTDMPQMVALYNGMGGGSAAAIGLVELLKFSAASATAPKAAIVFAVIGALIGSISLTGSLIAWAKLDGRMDKRFTFPGQQVFNLLVFLGALILGVMSVLWLQQP
ncbi:MAG: NAD(P)(+) transhydrogenase (Re/Si-specific) subunit beta, partial [Arenimonas sp.]